MKRFGEKSLCKHKLNILCNPDLSNVQNYPSNPFKDPLRPSDQYEALRHGVKGTVHPKRNIRSSSRHPP